MAKQIGGIGGPYQGKIGNVVGYQWKGKWVTRAVARNFHDAESELQLEQRNRLGSTMSFAARLRDILLLGLKKPALAAQMTEYNYFYHINKGCLKWDGEALEVDYEHLRLSEGPLAPVAFTHVERGETSDELVIDFEKNPEHRNCNSSDKVYVAAVCAERCEAVLALPVYRRMRRITVLLPVHWEGLEVHLYGFVQDTADRTSETVYIGGGTVEEMVEAYREEPEPGLPEATDGQPQVAESLTQSGTDFSSPETAIPRDAARGPS